jgi:hypothetical protein
MEARRADRSERPESCLHCVIMTTIESWFEYHGEKREGQVIIDLTHAISKLAECTVELSESAGDRSSRRRAFRFTHEALDANLKSQRTGKLVPVDIPAEH